MVVRGEERRRRKRNKIFGKGRKFLEKVNIWSLGKKKGGRKRRKIFGKGKSLVIGEEEKGEYLFGEGKCHADGQTHTDTVM